MVSIFFSAFNNSWSLCRMKFRLHYSTIWSILGQLIQTSGLNELIFAFCFGKKHSKNDYQIGKRDKTLRDG